MLGSHAVARGYDTLGVKHAPPVIAPGCGLYGLPGAVRRGNLGARMVVKRRGSACAEMQERLAGCQALPLDVIR